MMTSLGNTVRARSNRIELYSKKAELNIGSCLFRVKTPLNTCSVYHWTSPGSQQVTQDILLVTLSISGVTNKHFPGTLSSAEVQAFVILIRCAKCTDQAAVACNSVPALTLLSGSTPAEKNLFEL